MVSTRLYFSDFTAARPWACRRGSPSTGPGPSGMLVTGPFAAAVCLPADLGRAYSSRPGPVLIVLKIRRPEAAGAAVADLSKRTRLVSRCAAGASLPAECCRGVDRRRCRWELSRIIAGQVRE